MSWTNFLPPICETGKIIPTLAVIFSLPITGAVYDPTDIPPAGDPFACQTFNLRVTPQDAGTAVTWALQQDCHFGADVPITVTTLENGVQRDRFDKHGSVFEGTQVRRVPLSPKPLCTSSTVQVVATYKYMSIGDRRSDELKIVYDPNDNCDMK